MHKKLSAFFNYQLLYSFVLTTGNWVMSTDQSIFCEFCCPHLFSSSKGIINVRDSPSLLHSISYIIRCMMSTDEVVIVSDHTSPHPTWLNSDRYNKNDEKMKIVCTHAENVLLSHVQATDFLQSDLGYFQRLVPTFDPTQATTYAAIMAKRTNFILISDSHTQMVSLIAKVEKELQHLRIGRKIFWQPYIIFLWPEVQHYLRGVSNKNKTHEMILKLWFQNHQPYFTLDSGVFMFFIVQKGNSTRSQMNLYLSIWECYKLKGRFIVQEVTRQPHVGFKKKTSRKEEKCNGTMRDGNSMLSRMEKVNSYVFLERFLRREDFQLLPLTASIVPSDSSDWISMKQYKNGTVKLERGSSVDLYYNLQILMNFSEDVLLGDGVQFRAGLRRNRNDTFLALRIDKADILLNQKSVTPARGLIYSFLQPTYHGIYEAFFRQPSANTIRNIVKAPFTITLWVVTITSWLTIVGCLYGWGFMAKRNYLLMSRDDAFIEEVGLWAVAAISQKSWYMSPSSTNFKSIYYIGSLMALVCYVAYSAMIVSFLTVKIVPIQSLEDLIQYNYKFTVHESSEATVSLLKEMIINYGLHQNIIKISTADEITHLTQGTKALLSYPDLFYRTAFEQNFTENFLCTTIDSMPIGNTPYKSAMSVSKGSQYRETFSTKLLLIMERGLNFRYIKAYDENKEINCAATTHDQGERKTVIDPVLITDVFTAFLVIFIGWFVALWMFFTERLFRRRKTSYYSIVFLLQ